jgi:Sulfotransferase domain
VLNINRHALLSIGTRKHATVREHMPSSHRRYADWTPERIRRQFSGYSSQVDWPGAHVWRDLAAAYPQARVIHTVRPEQEWWKSFSQTIAAVLISDQQMPSPPPHILVPGIRPE